MLPVITALLSQLAASGLSTLGNAIIAKGADVIEEKLGIDINKTMQTEDGRIKLLQLQQEHEQYLLSAAIQKEELALKAQAMSYADTDSARAMNTRVNESVSASWLTKNIAALLATAVVLGGGVILVTTNEADVRTAVVGLITLVLGFYFGSTSSSKAKDEAIHALSNK
jgi:hypothetical protein